MNYFNQTIFFVLLAGLVYGQSRPNVLPEDMDENSLSIKCYCKPGVRNKTKAKGLEISYQFLGSGHIKAPNGEFSAPYPEYSKFRKFTAKLSFPVIRKQQFKTIIGVSYNAEQFELIDTGSDYQNLISGVDDLSFKSSSVRTVFSYSPNETNYIGAKFSASFNGSYDGIVDFSDRYAVYSGALAFGIKKNEDNEWGFGIAGSSNFRKQGLRVLPFAFWNKTFNDNWGFQITFPTSYNLRYNYNKKTILLASASYNGESYSYDQVSNGNRPIAFNHAEILTRLRMEREIVPWLWMDVSIGYHFNFNSNFELQTTNESLLDIDPGNSYYFKFGLFISPPDSFLDKK